MHNEDHIEREIRELDAFAKELMKKFNDNEVIEKLIKEKNLQEQYARAIVAGIYDAKERKSNFWRSILMGSSALFGGALLTIISYGMSESGGSGSFFIIFPGIIAAGAIIILRGFILYK